ncbi:unannotated protein [freshwater metagenome]|uniref:Unannotated protein n=1 Tax=freshwater metagenome TaxID=449393 RepID=A0A6J6PQ08_9ZZZZ
MNAGFVVGDHERDELLVGFRAFGCNERLQVTWRGESGHTVERHCGVIHPHHGGATLVCFGFAVLAEQLDHSPDVYGVTEGDLFGDEMKDRVCARLRDVDQSHLNGLLVMGAHVL